MLFCLIFIGGASSVLASGGSCTPPGNVNQNCTGCCSITTLPKIDKFIPPIDPWTGYIGRNGASNTIATCSGYGGCYFYDNANVYQCSCGEGLHSDSAGYANNGQYTSQGDIITIESLTAPGNKVTVLCVGGSVVGGDCGDIVAMSLPASTCTGGGPGGLNCHVKITKIGRLADACGQEVNGVTQGAGTYCCCGAIQQARACTYSMECMTNWIGAATGKTPDQLYSGTGSEGNKCSALRDALIAEISDMLHNCQCYGNANPNSSTAGAITCDASGNLGDGLCETLASIFANVCAIQQGMDECGSVLSEVENYFGLPGGSLSDFGSGIMACQNPIDICYHRPQSFYDINAALVAYAKAHPPGFCEPLNNGSSSGGSSSGGRDGGSDSNIVCHPNNWADLSYLGYCSNQYSANQLDIVGIHRLFMSPMQLCYPHKKTFQEALYKKGEEGSGPQPNAPSFDPNYGYYYLPDCYKKAQEVRDKNLPLFAQLEGIDQNYRKLRLEQYSAFTDALTPKPVTYSGGSHLAQIVCTAVSSVVDGIGKPLSVVAVLAVVMMVLFGKADWRLLMATATGIAIIFGAEAIVQQIAGGGSGSCGGGSDSQVSYDQTGLDQVLKDIHVKFDSEAIPILDEIRQNENSLAGCRESLLGVDDDFASEYRSFGCDPTKTTGNVTPEAGAPPLQNKQAMENCVDAHIENHRHADIRADFFDLSKTPADILTKYFEGSRYSKPQAELVEDAKTRLDLLTNYGNKKITQDVFKRGAGVCYPLVISPLSVNPNHYPPYQRIYERNHPFSPRQLENNQIGKEWEGYPQINGDPRIVQGNGLVYGTKGFNQRMCWDELTQCGRSPDNRRVVAVMQWRVGEYTGCEQCLGEEGTHPKTWVDSSGVTHHYPCTKGVGQCGLPTSGMHGTNCHTTGSATIASLDSNTTVAGSGSLRQLFMGDTVAWLSETWRQIPVIIALEKRGAINQIYQFMRADTLATASCGPIPGNYNDYDMAPPYSGPLSIRSDVDDQSESSACQNTYCSEEWDNGGDTCHQVVFYMPDGPAMCGHKSTTHQECCDILTRAVVMDNALPLRMTEDAFSRWQTDEPDGNGDPKSPQQCEGYPHWEHSTQHYPNHQQSWWLASFRFGDDFSQEPDHPKQTYETKKSMGVLPFMQWWEEGYSHCEGCNDAIVGVGNMHKQCLYGGWEEMKMYQARCYAYFGVHCLCDYEQTFKQGSAEEYALFRAGAVFSQSVGDEGKVEGEMVVRQAARYWPLSWRGYVSDPQIPKSSPALPPGGQPWGANRRFPYADGDYGTVTAAISNGLDNARAGQIVIWDYDVVHGSGRFSHVAYIEEARTKAVCEAAHCGAKKDDMCSQCGNDTSEYYGSTGPYIKVAEWNFGKFPDACENTDRWGQETRRWIYKLEHPKFEPGGRDLADYAQPDVISYNPSLTCGDPVLKRCWENLWDKVKVYDPTKDVRRSGSYPNTCNCHSELDNISERDILSKGDLVAKAVDDRQLGCDPPLSLREIPSRDIVGSRTMTNISIPNTQSPPEASQYEMEKRDISPMRNQLEEAPKFEWGGGGSGSGGSGSSSGGQTCPRDTSAVVMSNWATSSPACTIAFPSYSSSVFYSPEEIQNGTFPPNAVSPDNPVDKSPRSGPYCQTPDPQQCTDPPFCFLHNPNILSCDWQGYMRNVRDKTFPFYTASRTDPLYRDSGYSNDYVVDYLYYKIGFFDPVANQNASNWMKLMLQYPPIYWVDKLGGETCWMIGADACSASTDPVKRLVWILNKNNSTAPIYKINADVDKNIKVGKTVAVIVSDEYYQGLAGIVNNYDATNKCINVASSNWLKQECQAYDDKNCYQIYDSMGVGCTATCIPLSKVALMWNPDLATTPTLPVCLP